MRGNIPQYQTVRDGCDPTFFCKTPIGVPRDNLIRAA